MVEVIRADIAEQAAKMGPSRGRTDYEAVRALCAACPVRQECLEVALADSDLLGLWGGTTDAERRELRRSRVA